MAKSRIAFGTVNDQEKQASWNAAGEAVAALVQDGMRLGLGTGRSAAAGIRAVGRRVRGGLSCSGVPTSVQSDELATAEGIDVRPLGDDLHLAFDGADAVTADGLVVKGAGGAMVRERIVALAADRFVVLVDDTKLVTTLDEWGRLPIAVLPFAEDRVTLTLADLRPARRTALSDDGLVLIDLHPEAGADWRSIADAVATVPGVVDHGLFTVDPQDVLVGRPDGARPMPEVR